MESKEEILRKHDIYGFTNSMKLAMDEYAQQMAVEYQKWMLYEIFVGKLVYNQGSGRWYHNGKYLHYPDSLYNIFLNEKQKENGL